MPLKLILTFYFILALGKTGAQDTIYFKNKTKVHAKVIEVGITDIKYTQADKGISNIQSADQSTLEKILFSNGKTQYFQNAIEAKGIEESPAKESKTKLFRNTISANIFPLLRGYLGIQYQRTFYKIGISLVAMYNYNLNKEPNYSGGTTQYKQARFGQDYGFGVYFHAKEKNKFFYLGPVFRYMDFTAKSSYIILDGYGKPFEYIQYADFSRYIGAITTGYLVGNHTRFSFNIYASFGFRYDVFHEDIFIPFTQTRLASSPYPIGGIIFGGCLFGFNF